MLGSRAQFSRSKQTLYIRTARSSPWVEYAFSETLPYYMTIPVFPHTKVHLLTGEATMQGRVTKDHGVLLYRLIIPDLNHKTKQLSKPNQVHTEKWIQYRSCFWRFLTWKERMERWASTKSDGAPGNLKRTWFLPHPFIILHPACQPWHSELLHMRPRHSPHGHAWLQHHALRCLHRHILYLATYPRICRKITQGTNSQERVNKP